MEIHSSVGSVVGVGVAVVGNECVLLAGLGRAGFWGRASFGYEIGVPRVLLLEFFYFAVALAIVESKHVDRSKEIP